MVSSAQNEQTIERGVGDRPVSAGRRAVLRTAAWSVPVIAAAAAAPAYAASPCPTDTVDWSTGWKNTTTGIIASGTSRTIGHAVVTLTYTGDTGATDNGIVYTAGPTGTVANALRFYDLNNKANTAQTVTITFDKQVKNVALSLLDVDSATNSFFDQVLVNTTGFTFANGSTVQGNGTATNLFRATNANTAVPGTSSTGNVQLNWVGPVTSISFTYSQQGTATGSPFIGITNVAFQAQDC